ncbi:hypothetical protein EXIGLDRAFT_729433 [Exidia glandulosa HHB12029]|uniref:F-box domain-containing protein n=1 Tax=Exidia glandulosa HHB12029 TaxID=1314781 RepID=A0A165LJ43_EXIGL|nr:hypothetical protein EXIGLDRAFT_729433 [Exidia glandulosa HHB12029]
MAGVLVCNSVFGTSSINGLPDDVLLEIFYAAQRAAAADGSELQLAFTIACVCSRWRTLAVAYGQLWSRVCVYVPKPGPDLSEVVHIVLSRLGTVPLALRLVTDRYICYTAEDRMATMAGIKAVASPVSRLISRASSIRIVELPIQDPTSYTWKIPFEESIMSLLKVDTPHLRRLKVVGSTVSKRYGKSNTTDPRLLPFAPLLDTVVLNGPDWRKFAHCCIRSLDLSFQGSLPDFALLNAGCPELGELKLHLCRRTTVSDNRDMGIATVVAPVMFQNLTVLDVEPGYILGCIPCRTIPLIRSLKIHTQPWYWFSGTPMIRLRLPSMPTLCDLELTMANNETIPFLARLSSVTRLRISNSPVLAHFLGIWSALDTIPVPPLESLVVDGHLSRWEAVDPEDIGRNLVALLETRANYIQDTSSGHAIRALGHLRLEGLDLDDQIIARLSDLVEVIDVQA